MLCRKLDLFGRGLLAVEGTRIKAVNAKDKNVTKTGLTRAIKEADERLDAYLKQVDESDSFDKASRSGDHGSDGRGDFADKIEKLKAKQNRHKSLLKQMQSDESPKSDSSVWVNPPAYLFKALTPGSGLPSIHSRKAPPAVET